MASTIHSQALKKEAAVKSRLSNCWRWISRLNKLDDSETSIQDLLQELRYRMPNQLYKYTDKLEEGDLIKYRERLKVKELAGKKWTQEIPTSKYQSPDTIKYPENVKQKIPTRKHRAENTTQQMPTSKSGVSIISKNLVFYKGWYEGWSFLSGGGA